MTSIPTPQPGKLQSSQLQSGQLQSGQLQSDNLAASAAAINPPMRDTPMRAETPPPHYWRRWSGDAEAAGAVGSTPPAAAQGAADSTGQVVPNHDSADAPYRVLVVEDDPSQALFSEGVLNGVGIQAETAALPAEVMPLMEKFRPDLVLMDLHMPGMSGTELTALIRENATFAHTPIVFLTGDTDPERQFEVLECGADDFLSKPIRPRLLIAAVQSRIKRARALQRQRFGDASRHPVTGLFKRDYLTQRISAALSADSPVGGVLFVEIQNTDALHERFGFADFEQLIQDIGRLVGELAGSHPSARLNDSAFLVFVPDAAADLKALAQSLRDGISQTSFEMEGLPLRPRAVVGYSTFQHGFADAGSVLDAAGRAARNARTDPAGLAAYASPARVKANDELIEAMRVGLRDGAFELQFQPVVAVAGGEESQFQALLRMRNEDGSVRNAGELVPVAESAGLMPDIDRWVLEQAIELLHRRNEEQRPIRLFVSQSPHTLARDSHASWLLGMLASHDIKGPSLVIDLRMDDALVHSVGLRQFCEQLMPAGVQFCLSQYEHGQEVDALLSQLPLGYLRLAPRYSKAHTDSALRDQLRIAIDRAHRLGLQVIGPQVEDPQGAATLWMSGIDYIQGNLVQHASLDLDFDFQHSVL